MADKLGLGPEPRELKLGASFTNPKTTGFHTLRYDFKPASVDINQRATMDVGSNSQVTVTIPPNTVFKGSSKPYQKQCIVIINRDTKEITLEKLSCNIQVKKTRSEGKKITSVAPSIPTLDQFTSKNKKTSMKNHTSSKSSSSKQDSGASRSKSKPQLLTASLGSVVPKHSPLHASPNRKSPNPAVGFSPNRPTTNASSLPVIGSMLDDCDMDDKYHYSRDKQLSSHPPTSASSSQPQQQQAKGNYAQKSYPDKKDNNRSMSGSGVGGNCGNVISNSNNSKVSKKPVTADEVIADNDVNDAVGILSDSSSSSSSSSASSSASSSDSSDSEEAPPPVNKSQPVVKNQSSSRTTSALSVPEHLLTEDLQLSSESGSDSD